MGGMTFLQKKNTGLRKYKSRNYDLEVSGNNSSISGVSATQAQSPQKIDASPAGVSAFQSQKLISKNNFTIEL